MSYGQSGDHWKALTNLKGLPFGRIIQISGKPDSGKSTHAMAFMKFAQDQRSFSYSLGFRKKIFS